MVIIGQPFFVVKKQQNLTKIYPFCVNDLVSAGVIILYRDNSVYFNFKGNLP